MELFAALPAGDPSYPPADPRPGLPLDVFVGGQNQHILARSSWTDNTNTVFSYWDGNALTDHDHTFDGRFDLLSKGEWITKGRTEFNNYNNLLTSSEHSNEAGYQNITGSSCGTDACLWYFAGTTGGQWFESQEASVIAPLNYSILPGYVAASADTTGAYNANPGSTFSDYNDVTQASRSLIYLRGSNQVIYYDRGSTNHAAFKQVYLTSTGPITITGTQASWPTRSNTQKAYVTSLLPAGATITDLGAYCTVDQACVANGGDNDPYSHLKIEAASTPLSANFLTVLEWGASSFTKSATGLVQSSSGAAFDGAGVGSSLVMFSQNYPVSFTGTTFPASGATTIYVSDLSPNTTYAISAGRSAYKLHNRHGRGVPVCSKWNGKYHSHPHEQVEYAADGEPERREADREDRVLAVAGWHSLHLCRLSINHLDLGAIPAAALEGRAAHSKCKCRTRGPQRRGAAPRQDPASSWP